MKLGGAKVKKPEDLFRLAGEEGGGSFKNKTPEEKKKWLRDVRRAFKKEYGIKKPPGNAGKRT